jgi:hypothetical protein
LLESLRASGKLKEDLGGKERTSGSSKVRVLLGILATLVLLLAPAQLTPADPGISAPNWAEQFPTHSPVAREAAAMAYDYANQEMVLFGGRTGAGLHLGDTWTWDGDNWRQFAPAHSPSPRSDAKMAFDPVTEQLILVGGTTNDGATDETWTWDGNDWTRLTPATPAPALFVPSIATDFASGNVILFGGSSAGTGTMRNWTWVWDGSTWSELSPASSPPARFGAAMAYDQENQEIVLFGGGTMTSIFDDTWIWDGSNWTQKLPLRSPPSFGGGSMAFSPATNTLIHVMGSTWSWDGSIWSALNTWAQPRGRFNASLELDPTSGKLLLFGGNDAQSIRGDTWTFGFQSDQDPVAEITSPAPGGTYEIGESVPVSFSCEAAPDGPPVSTCLGSDGSPAPRGFLDTSKPGPGTFTVIATASDGQTGSASIFYEVRKPTPEPVCRAVPGGLTLQSFALRPPLGDGRQVPGLRVRLSATGRVDAEIAPRIAYGSPNGRKSFRYRARTVRVNRVRKLRYRLPAKVRREMLRSQGAVYGNRVTFRLRARIKARGDRPACYKRPESLAYELPVVAVSSRVALRRR